MKTTKCPEWLLCPYLRVLPAVWPHFSTPYTVINMYLHFGAAKVAGPHTWHVLGCDDVSSSHL